jgi:magnesium chelatase family protein
MHAKVFSATTIGVEARSVEVEVDVSFGLVQFYIVGLPDTAIKESSKRIQTALKNSGIRLPAKRITVNLAPADLKKEGTLFDLPIAIGILLASEHLKIDKDFLQNTLIIGELSLDGSIRCIKGALAIAYDAHKLNKKRIIVPEDNAQEAALISNVEIIGVKLITDLVAYLRQEKDIEPTQPPKTFNVNKKNQLDFSDVKGQITAKRALQIAAAGNHNILFIGPPGSGKTMLAKRLSSIMPTLSFSDRVQTSKIYSITGKLFGNPLIDDRPFRAPHHTISQAGLIGGGSYPQPGEISLAHNGILFLDELTEFKRTTIEALRQPLENKEVCIARAQQTITFPASFLLIAALNPCPCGYFGDSKKECVCSPQQIERYLGKLSGPLLDRIDLQISVESVDYQTIKNNVAQESSSTVLERVNKAREMSSTRQQTATNALIAPNEIETICIVDDEGKKTLQLVFEKLHLSMRGYHKVLKVARTIADLVQSEIITAAHIREAVSYRSLDKYLESKRR